MDSDVKAQTAVRLGEVNCASRSAAQLRALVRAWEWEIGVWVADIIVLTSTNLESGKGKKKYLSRWVVFHFYIY